MNFFFIFYRIESSQGSGYGLRHSWLDARGNVIGAPGLNAYGTHSELGRVVQAIKRAFEKDPPVVYGGQQPNNSHNVSTGIVITKRKLSTNVIIMLQDQAT